MVALPPRMAHLLCHLQLSLLEFLHQCVALLCLGFFEAGHFDTNLLFSLFR